MGGRQLRPPADDFGRHRGGGFFLHFESVDVAKRTDAHAAGVSASSFSELRAFARRPRLLAAVGSTGRSRNGLPAQCLGKPCLSRAKAASRSRNAKAVSTAPGRLLSHP